MFFKDMGCHVSRCLSRELLENFENLFIIRDPKKVLPSLFHMWPDFTMEEAGYEPLYRVFELAGKITGGVPIVIDADDLTRKPEAVVRAFCARTGLEFLPGVLEWEKKPVPEWKMWEDWHKDAAGSSGFHQASAKKYLAIEENDRLREAYASCLPYYLKMARHRL